MAMLNNQMVSWKGIPHLFWSFAPKNLIDSSTSQGPWLSAMPSYAQPRKGYDNTDLVSIIQHHKPDVLIGAVGKVPGCFTEELSDALGIWMHMGVILYDIMGYDSMIPPWFPGFCEDIHGFQWHVMEKWRILLAFSSANCHIPGGSQGHAGRPSGQSNAGAAHHLCAVQSHESGRDHRGGEMENQGILYGIPGS